MVGIVELDVFPGLDRVDPLDDFDKDDVVPPKFLNKKKSVNQS